MSRSRQIAINAVTQWGGTGLSAVLGLLIVPFLILRLGQDGYGLVVVILAIASLCALADLGISGALARHLAEALARQDNEEFNQCVSTAVAVNLMAGTVCAVALFLLAEPLARVFSLPEALLTEGAALLRTFGAGYLFLTFVMFAPKGVLASHNRFDLACLIDAVRRLVQTVGLFAVLSLTNLGLVGWALVCISVEIGAAALLWRAAFRIRRDLRIGWRSFRPARLRSLYGLGSQLTVLQISSHLSVNADPFILSACLGPGSVSLYRPPAQVVGALSQVVFTLANQLHPVATQAHVQGDKVTLASVLLRGTKYTMLMGAVGCGILISLAYPLCKVWLGGAMGEQYRICAAVLIIQAVTLLGAFGAGTQWPVLLGTGRTAFAAYGRLALAVVNILVSWVLVRHTSLGIVGVVIPTMIIELVWRPVLACYVCRVANVRLTEYARRSYTSPLLIGAAVAAVGLGLQWAVEVERLWALGAVAAALGLMAAGMIWFSGFSETERGSMRDVARSVVERCA